MLHAVTWMDLENTLNGTGQTQEDACCMIPLVRGTWRRHIPGQKVERRLPRAGGGSRGGINVWKDEEVLEMGSGVRCIM